MILEETLYPKVEEVTEVGLTCYYDRVGETHNLRGGYLLTSFACSVSPWGTCSREDRITKKKDHHRLSLGSTWILVSLRLFLKRSKTLTIHNTDNFSKTDSPRMFTQKTRRYWLRVPKTDEVI